MRYNTVYVVLCPDLNVFFLQGSGSSVPHPDFTNPGPDPTHSTVIVSSHFFSIHQITDKKSSSSPIKSASEQREKIYVLMTWYYHLISVEE